VPATPTSIRMAGFPQGLSLVLPVTLAVVGVAIFTATVAQMQAHFSDIPNGKYLVNLLQTMPGFWIVAFSPVAGWLADRFGRRPLLLYSMAFYAIAGVAPFSMDNIYAILATRCVVGMCESVVLTVTTTMLCDYFKGQARERWLAGQSGVGSLSVLIIIPLGGKLGAIYGWQGPFLVYAISLVWLACVAVFCWEPEHELHASDEIAKINADARYQQIPWARMSGIMVITLISSVMFHSPLTQNANAFVELGVRDPAEIGRWATLASIGVPIGTVCYWALGRLRIDLLFFVEYLLIGLGFTLMSRAATPMEYALAANLQQVGFGLTLPMLLVWATRGLAYHIRGRGNGLWQGTFGLGLFVSGVVMQFLGELFDNSILKAFGALGEVCLIAAALTIIGMLAQRAILTGKRA